MKSGSITTALIGVALAVVLSSVWGCHGNRPGGNTRQPPVVRAVYCEAPIVVDGKLDEAAWRAAPAYPLAGTLDQPLAGTCEVGRVRACWDEQHLYIAFEFEDSDVIAESPEGERHHYRFGDTAELFLKPIAAPCYWEMHATPRGQQATYFYPSFGRFGLPSNFDTDSELRVAATVEGTINNGADRDRGWAVEFAIPVSDLARRTDAPWGVGTAWSVLAGRYNYGRYNQACELTSHPTLAVTDFHDRTKYAVLTLERSMSGREE